MILKFCRKCCQMTMHKTVRALGGKQTTRECMVCKRVTI